MHKLRFSIDIKAPRERVWKVLWDDATFRDWASVFMEGSYINSDWKEDNTCVPDPLRACLQVGFVSRAPASNLL